MQRCIRSLATGGLDGGAGVSLTGADLYFGGGGGGGMRPIMYLRSFADVSSSVLLLSEVFNKCRWIIEPLGSSDCIVTVRAGVGSSRAERFAGSNGGR